MFNQRTTYSAETMIEGIAQVQYGWDPQIQAYYVDAIDPQGQIVTSTQWENTPTRLSYLLAQLDYYGVSDPRAYRAVKQGLPF